MKNIISQHYLVVLLLIAVITASFTYFSRNEDEHASPAARIKGEKSVSKLKLYWFIPDGFRADPDVFKLFEWARQGELPNIKRLMDSGSYGYSIPVFPGHTPSNFATLSTGTYPDTHGIVDGPIRLPGYPLQVVARNGFSSHAKRVPPIWYTLEKYGEKVSLLSVPGSTPPELSKGITIRGRWGGWGMDFPAVNFNSTGALKVRRQQGLENRLFEHGASLTSYIDPVVASGWQIKVKSSSRPFEIVMENWGVKTYGLIYDSSDDNKINYDRIL
ncbi:MAG: alkaline phosphatase family protein, partial [Gammaproteobacteria bacterium]|nr:alkaline phosphatase family protein [Gammaproteobacteria bacterium]